MKEQNNHQSDVIDASQRCRDLPWGCLKCGTLLGFVDKETKSTIRVKYRDFYIKVYNPDKITISCRGCGDFNDLEAKEDLLQDARQ